MCNVIVMLVFYLYTGHAIKKFPPKHELVFVQLFSIP